MNTNIRVKRPQLKYRASKKYGKWIITELVYSPYLYKIVWEEK